MAQLTEEERYRQIRSVLWIVLFLNFAVAAAKLFFGWLTNTASITADGYHSFSDGSSNIIGLLGIWLASKPRDDSHPYETLTSVGIALLLFAAAFRILSDAIGRFYHPVELKVGAASFVVMVCTLVVNIFVMRYERRKGRMLRSEILISDSFHTTADIFTTCSVIIGLLVVKSGYPMFDPMVAAIISILIGFAGIEILKDTSRVLVDAAAIDKKRIWNIAMGIDGIKSCHKIRSRGRPGDILIDMHCHMEYDMSLEDAHRLAHVVERRVKEDIDGVKDVTIHIEPFGKSG
jgi:cation diffusion facilitator family transporter